MGSDKARLPVGKETMLQRIVGSLAAVVSPVVVVAARHQELPVLAGSVVVVRDEYPDRGPLEGIRRGLQHLPSERSFAFVSGCDTPLLKTSLVRWLLAQRFGYDLVVPVDASRPYPLTAVYHRQLAAQIDVLFRLHQHRLVDLLPMVHSMLVGVDQLRDVDPRLDSLRNINTPEDYQAVVREMAEM